MNLCINARDALEGRPAPRLDLHVASDGDTVSISVADNGVGMSADVQRRIGEPFFTTKPPGRGTGLGLAMAYGIVAELGGSLTCHSTPGEGTRFELKLPRQRTTHEVATPSVPAASPLNGLRVLLIDDEERVLATLSRAIARLGAEVLCAERGSDALELVRANPDIGFVLLDLAMPEMPGVEVLRRIRELRPNVPVHIMTGFLPGDVDTTGAHGVLAKPIELARLKALLAAAVRS
jgi:CheY-like chemotaxis protein